MKKSPEQIGGEGMLQAERRDSPERSAAALQSNTGPTASDVSPVSGLGWDVLLCVVVAIIAAMLMPLDDADLPMHLRTGAWILDNGRLPLTEPFSWTRVGAPFFAYSWLPEIAFEGARRAFGWRGVSAVHALLIAGAVMATWDLSRAARWSVWATRLMMSLHVILWLLVQPATRPQLVLAIALPMAWASAYRLRSVRSPLPALAATAIASALAVNSHLLFPLTIVPVVVLLGADRFRSGRTAAFLGATLLGWLCSPNAPHLLEILRLNLGHNALLGAASPIMELEPGFTFLLGAAVGTKLLAGLLIVLPLLPSFARLPQRERWWLGLAWAAGLGLFGLAIRGLLLWWLLAMPLVAVTLASIPLPSLAATKRAVIGAWVVAACAPVGHALKARELLGAADGLPHPQAKGLAPAVRWLECATGGGAVGDAAIGTLPRGTNTFDVGSYLVWRVPTVSWSVDGRTIFPDSVARAEAAQQLRYGAAVNPPFTHADLVLLSPKHAAAKNLDTDSHWERVPIALTNDTTSLVLWARTLWLKQRPDVLRCAQRSLIR